MKGDFGAYFGSIASHIDHEERERILDGQKPFAVVIACADSRVPPELLFGVGLGQIFVIRVAGVRAFRHSSFTF